MLLGVIIALVLVVKVGLSDVSFSLRSNSAEADHPTSSMPSQQVYLQSSMATVGPSPDTIAQTELSSVIGMLSYRPESFGIQDTAKLQQAVLGIPIPEYTVNWDVLQHARGDTQNLMDALVDSHAWLYPLLVDGIPSAEMKVGFLDGRWQVVSISGMGLSPAVVVLQHHYPSLPTSLRLVSIPERATALIVIDEADHERIVIVGSQHPPLASLARLYPSGPVVLDPTMDVVSYTAAEIIPLLMREADQ